MIEIKVPTLGESVTEATLAKWQKNPGDFVKNGDLLVELETDKVTLEVSSPSDGILMEIFAKTGDNVSIGAILCKVQQSNVSADINIEKNNDKSSYNSHENHIAAPSARRIIAENNLEINHIKGTGKEGRITKQDAANAVIKHENRVEAEDSFIAKNSGVLLQNQKLAVQQSKNDSSIISEDKGRNDSVMSKTIVEKNNIQVQEVQPQGGIIAETRVPMTRLRKTIATRLKDSQNTAAILTTFNEVDMFEIMKLRQIHQEAFLKKYNIKLGFMSFFVKATVQALKDFPIINSSIDGNDILYKNYYNIGVAVGTENGLVVPVLKDADRMSLSTIEIAIANLAKKARENKITMSDMSGGSFSITNGGIYGSMLSTPIINPPQSAILGMHNIVQRPVVLNNNDIIARPIMFIALSYDHRLIDGREAVQFLVRIKEQVEKPEKMLLEI